MKKIPIKINFVLASIIFLFTLPQSALADIDYQAQKTDQSQADIIELTPTQTSEFWVKFKNTGQSPWSGMGEKIVILRTVSGMKSKLTHSSWASDYIPNQVNPVTNIYPGDEALFRFTLLAPNQAGLYWEKFELFAGSEPIAGGKIEVAVKVAGPGAVITPTPTPTPPPTPPTAPPAAEEQLFWQNLPAEINIINQIRWPELNQGPEIKVGLLYVEKEEKDDYLPFKISTLNNASYDIYDQNGNLLVRNTAGELMEIDYDYSLNRYFINNGNGERLLMTDSFVKFQGAEPVIFKINNWQNGPFWDGGKNDNEFRQGMEIRYNSSTERLWLINRLPLEEYVRSVAEVGDSSPNEFLKAQMVAARTYALFRYLTPKYTNTADGQPFFTVQATQADQVYRGYQREQRAPNTLAAAEQTKGIVATYQNDPILAYYFAQSDGQTRSSYEAKMTAAPVNYLIAKTDPPGQGKTLLGHGVGLPQTSGISAANQGANYSQILKYYYTGIELTKIY